METKESETALLLIRFLEQAVNQNASDLHLEPQRDCYRIRVRIDGSLHTIHIGPLHEFSSLINRLKVLCKMDIAERRKPQDGGFRENYGDKSIDFRVSVIPVTDGEKAAVRILDHHGIDLHYASLGFSEDRWSELTSFLKRRSGLVIFTGPTGSGKTTTLYTLLKELNEDCRHILTLEDPVEYRLSGINQIQVNERIQLTFSSGLRAILRQDPEIIMVGEIRDKETAEIAVRAAITGHLVLSTLHTNDSHTAIVRLRDMGIEPYLIAASLTGVSSQRLVKRLCPFCKKEEIIPPKLMSLYDSLGYANPSKTHFVSEGCQKCRGGYAGRVAISEVLPINESIREGILLFEDLRKLRDRTPHFQPLIKDGLTKIQEGITDYKEVFGILYE